VYNHPRTFSLEMVGNHTPGAAMTAAHEDRSTGEF